MKRIGTTALTLALAGALALPAAADGPANLPEAVDPPAPANYTAAVFVNGTELDLSGIPYASGIPARKLAEADYGFADWYPEEDQGFFALDGHSINVTFSTGAIEVDGAVLEGVAAEVKEGVTYLPPQVIDGLEGYTVHLNPELDAGRIDITTPNGSPLVQAAYQIREASGAAASMKAAAADLELYGFLPGDFVEVAALFPMNVSPDTVLVGKVAEGRMDSVKAALEAYRQTQEDTFSWYLPDNLPKVLDARVEVQGDYILFLIAGNAGGGVALFQSIFS